MLSAHDAEVVRHDADLPGLAVLLDPDAFLEVLSQEFPFLRATKAETLYLRYKPGTSCLCSYRVSGADGPFHVYGKAFPGVRGEKLRHWRTDGRSTGRPRRSASDTWHLGISRFPDDRGLKALARLQSPSRRDRILASAFAGYPYDEHAVVTTLRYKPERRYVARVAWPGMPGAALKMYDGAGYHVAQAKARMFSSREALLVPSCNGESDRFHLLGFEWVPGRSLHEELAGSGGPDAARMAGAALAELHCMEIPSSLSTLAAVRAVHAAAGSVAAVLPQLAPRVRSLARDIEWRLHAPSEDLRPAHGDFHAEQVVVAGNRAVILDFDRACLSSPAADLGTFAAHLQQSVLRGMCRQDDADAGLEALVEGYSRRRAAPAPERLGTYTAAALVRLAPEPFRRHDRSWPELTEALLERASEALASRSPHISARAVAGGSTPRVAVLDAPGLTSDPAWFFLRSALDPSTARAHLDGALARIDASDAALREIRVSRCKPGRRCLVEYAFDRNDATQSEPIVILGKSRMKGLNANAHFALESLWNAGFTPSRSAVCVPQPLGGVPAWRMTLQRKVNGDPAGERLAQPDGVLVATRIAEAIYRLHTRGVAPARQHTVDDELQILRERLRQMRGHRERIERLLKQCEQLASELPRARPQPIHRDFYPAHVLVDGHRLWLIDLDLYCAGDPGLDVGNFIAHLIEERLRRHGFAEGLDETESALEARYVQLAGRHLLPAIRTYTTLSLVRHVHLSTQYPERFHTTGALLDLCERRLSAGLDSKLYA